MNQPPRPVLDAVDDLTAAVDIDISEALRGIIAQRVQSPINPPSRAADISAMIAEDFPEGGDNLDQLVELITRATGRFPRNIESRTLFSPAGSSRAKSGARSPTFGESTSCASCQQAASESRTASGSTPRRRPCSATRRPA